MKRLLFFLTLLVPLGMKAQVSIQFNQYNSIYLNATCPTPATTYFNLNIFTTGLNPQTDSVDVMIDYGNSVTDSVRVPVYTSSLTQQYAYVQFAYTYQNPGIYSPVCMCSAPPFDRDTLTMTNAIVMTNTCNNLNGHLFRDNNLNCVYDAGDDPLANELVEIRHTGATIGWTAMTDNAGYYQASLLTGETYEVNYLNYYSTVHVPLNCSLPDTQTVVSTGSNTIDFPLNPVTRLEATSVTDSLPAVCYGNGTFWLNAHANYYGEDTVSNLQFYIDFGDGNDTILFGQLYNSSSVYFSNAAVYIQHHYPGPGVYSLMTIVTDPSTGIDDTLYSMNDVELLDSCGNISGYVFKDVNTDCIFSLGDDTLDQRYVYIEQNSVFITGDFTDSTGYYSFDVPAGNYSVTTTAYAPNSGYQMTCSTTPVRNVNVPLSGSVAEDFGVICNTSVFDDSPLLFGRGFRPGGNGQAVLMPYLEHLSCQTTSGTVTIILDPLTSFASSCDPNFPYTVNGNSISWPYSAVNPNNYFWEQYPCIWLNVDTTAQIGDTVCFTMFITPTVQDNNPSNDTFHICRPVTNSWDPNAKEVYPNGPGGNGHVAPNTELTYTIFFQNTGTDTAYNVAIIDTIDPNLDMTSIQVVGASHSMVPDVIGANVLRFNFNGIYLPDSTTNEPQSHGWVTYKINMLPWLPDATVINNTADIYFDFNAAVITNTTQTVVDWLLSTKEFSIEEPTLYPVPANEQITIESETEMRGTIQILDLTGRTVRSQSVNGKKVQMNTSDLADGTYIVTILDGNTLMKKKIVIQH